MSDRFQETCDGLLYLNVSTVLASVRLAAGLNPRSTALMPARKKPSVCAMPACHGAEHVICGA
jgi:hypothetical protein